MRVLIVGNYKPSKQKSMIKFGDLLYRLYVQAGAKVDFSCPFPLFGAFLDAEHGLGKWLGYIDKFIIYPFFLSFISRKYDYVHIGDHSNAMYSFFIWGRPVLVTCHDVMAVRAALYEGSSKRGGLSGRILQRWVLAGLKRANRVVCVSTKTKLDLISVLGGRVGDIDVVPNSMNHSFLVVADDESIKVLKEIDPRLGVSKFFLHVGGNQWYKNRAGVVRLYSELILQEDYKDHLLILAGKPLTKELLGQIRLCGLESKVIELCDLSNWQINCLYSRAEALLFPSLEEGFGWPIVEAQAAGCVVVTSDRAPMTEVGGQAAIYIDPNDLQAAAKLVGCRLRSRAELVDLGFLNKDRFTDSRMLEGYLGSAELMLGAYRGGAPL